MIPVHTPPRPRSSGRPSQAPTVRGADLAAETLRSVQGAAPASEAPESAPSVPADSDAGREYGEFGSLWRCACTYSGVTEGDEG